MVCYKCRKLECQLLEANNQNKKLCDKYNASKNIISDLITKYGISEELDSSLLVNTTVGQNNDNSDNSDNNDHIDSQSEFDCLHIILTIIMINGILNSSNFALE